MDMQHFNLRAIAYQEDDQWVAHCLELDIVAQGGSPDESIRELGELCMVQIEQAIEDGDIDGLFVPAPADVWRRFFMHSTLKKVPRKSTSAFRRRLDFVEFRQAVPA